MLPFTAIMFWLSTGFVGRSFRSGEKSDYGGMIDRFAIKSVIPIGFAILFVVILARVIRRFLESDRQVDGEIDGTDRMSEG